jgi:hypothetical protein
MAAPVVVWGCTRWFFGLQNFCILTIGCVPLVRDYPVFTWLRLAAGIEPPH